MKYGKKYSLKNLLIEATNQDLNSAKTGTEYEAVFVKAANDAISGMTQVEQAKPVQSFRRAEYNKSRSYVRIFALPNSFVSGGHAPLD